MTRARSGLKRSFWWRITRSHNSNLTEGSFVPSHVPTLNDEIVVHGALSQQVGISATPPSPSVLGNSVELDIRSFQHTLPCKSEPT